jgi:hypothetical protein
MTDEYTEKEIDRLHEKLALIYRRGLLTQHEVLETKGLWARIERLESARVAAIAKESKFREAQRGS